MLCLVIFIHTITVVSECTYTFYRYIIAHREGGPGEGKEGREVRSMLIGWVATGEIRLTG